MSGTFTVSGASLGLLTGSSTTGPLTMVGSATIGVIGDLVLAMGDNTVPVPAGAVAVLIVMPVTGGVQLKVRTNLNSGDVGLPIGTAGWSVISFYTGVIAIILNVASAMSGVEMKFI